MVFSTFMLGMSLRLKMYCPMLVVWNLKPLGARRLAVSRAVFSRVQRQYFQTLVFTSLPFW